MEEDEETEENAKEVGKYPGRINQDEFLSEAKSFFETHKKELGEISKSGNKTVIIDFQELSEHSPEIVEYLIMKPEETLQILELALEELEWAPKKARVRLKSISKSQEVKIRDIRAKHLGSLICIEGIVRQASEVRPQVTNAKFECPSCGTIISVLQIDKKFKEPSRCSCGRRGGFKELSKDMVDAQRLVIEESPDSLTGGEQPKRMTVFLKEDLVDPKMEERTTPGSRVKIIGLLQEVALTSSTGAMLTRFDLAVEANNVIPMEETFEDIKISEEDERQIKELAADPLIMERITKSIAPSIWGHYQVKKALALQLFGGIKKFRSDGTSTRGDIHVLLVGDPGVAKSVMLKFIAGIAPKGRYVSGKSTSGAGLTASVVKDEFLKGWSLEAGAMVLSNKGLVCLHPDSNILVNDKVISIKHLFNEKNSKEFVSNNEKIQVSEINEKIHSLSGDSLQFTNQSATLVRRKKYEGELTNLTFDSGFSISLTPEHKIINGNNLSWQEAGLFKENDFVLAPLKINETNKNVYILDILPDDWIVCLNKSEKQELKKIILQRTTLKEFNIRHNLDVNHLSGGRQLKILIFKKILKDLGIYDSWKEKQFKYGRAKAGEMLKVAEITPELAYFFGFILGDGNIKSTKKHSLIQITQSLKNEKQINKIREVFSKFSCRTLGEYKRESHSLIRGKQVESEHYILYSGSNLLSYLAEFYIKNKLRNILNMPQECLKAFIAGCMDSDGCISVKKCTKNNKDYTVNHIEFLLSNDRETNKNFLLALRRLDCYAKFIEHKPINIVRMTGSIDVETLSREISNYSVKCKSLPKRKVIISSASSKIPSDSVSDLCAKIINNCTEKQELNNLGISSVLYEYKNKTRQPSREQLLKIKDKLPLSEELNNQIEVLARRDYFIDKIVKIKKEKYSGYVYDLFVPETHNFIADGIVVHNCIDELEKMDENDRSTMHEAMEQQCYLPNFNLMLSDGKEVKIGKFVDDLIEKNKGRVYYGENCEILPVEDVELISTDFSNHFPIKAERVSRHIAPEEFIKIELTDGKIITVTPEHPCWVTKEGKITTIPAEKLKAGEYFPIASEINIKEEDYKSENDYLCKILGYHISDGCYELNRGKKTGIQFGNNNKTLIDDYKNAIEHFFKLNPIITKRGKQFSVRVISKRVADYFCNLDKTLLEKGNIRKIPDSVLSFSKQNLSNLLRALFDGDGTVVNQSRNGCRVGLVTQNRILAEQVSTLLLRFEITSSIFNDKNVFRLDISGQENLCRFLLNIGFLSEHKSSRLRQYCEKEKTYRTIKNIIPGCTDKISQIFKKLKISARKEIGHSIDLHVEKQKPFLQKLVLIAEKYALEKKDKEILSEIYNIKKLAFGYANWMKIKKVERVKNESIKWVYDITIEPFHSFVSNGMILHNSVTISKANVQASLRAQTAVLAAANPKFGRFEPNEMIAKQVNLAPSLLNRFDCIFILKDLPNRERDESIAMHVLHEHKQDVKHDVIDKELLRKFISYTRQRIHPTLTDEAIQEFKNFYVNLRNQPTFSESASKPIPISARQLEALVRLAEARSRTRLGKKVTKEDALDAIELVKYYLLQVGYDEETKTIDIDRLGGNPASQRNKIYTVKEVLESLENRLGKLIPLEELEKELKGKMKETEIEEAIDKLIRSGDLFRPRKGYVQRM